VSFVAGEFDHGRPGPSAASSCSTGISDPDVRADIHAAPISGCIWSGRFREARRLAQAHDEITMRLTPHHRLHGVAITIEVEELLAALGTSSVACRSGPSSRSRRTSRRRASAIRACCSSRRVAHELGGNPAEARSLEQAALDRWMEGYGATLDTPRVRLALARGDLGRGRAAARTPGHAARLAPRLVRVRERRREARRARSARAARSARGRGAPPRTAAELPPALRLRALGRVRGDEALVREALAEFEAYGLGWFAAETRASL
jgi:hypothetical protein